MALACVLCNHIMQDVIYPFYSFNKRPEYSDNMHIILINTKLTTIVIITTTSPRWSCMAHSFILPVCEQDNIYECRPNKGYHLEVFKYWC